MDASAVLQTLAEPLVILIAAPALDVAVGTIAPRFLGSFHLGVDFEGDLDEFDLVVRRHLAILRHAVAELGRPADLRASLHSGGDKFRLYPRIGRALRDTDAGLHVKTEGTARLEEVVALAFAGGEALGLVKGIYRRAWPRFDALLAPYGAVIGIRRDRRSLPEAVDATDAPALVTAVDHNPARPMSKPAGGNCSTSATPSPPAWDGTFSMR